MTLGDIFDECSIKLDIEAETKDAAFAELVEAITAAHPEFDKVEMLAALREREQKMSTGVAAGIAIPHCCCAGITTMAGAIGISRAGIEYDALDHKPVHVVFMLVMGEAAREHHLGVLNQIFSLVKSEAPALIRGAKNPQDVHEILARFR